MEQNEMNQAIARHLGWQFPGDPEFDAATNGWARPELWAARPPREKGGVMEHPPTMVFIHEIPKYSGDLNAMHEAEKALILEDVRKNGGYHDALQDARPVSAVPDACNWSWHASALHRAEAFLRTVGKWKEAE